MGVYSVFIGLKHSISCVSFNILFFSFRRYSGRATVTEHSLPMTPRGSVNGTHVTKKVKEKSRECHNHKPQLFPDTKRKRKRKPTKPTKHKSNKRTKSTKISFVFPRRGNRNAKRIEKHKNKITQGKT